MSDRTAVLTAVRTATARRVERPASYASRATAATWERFAERLRSVGGEPLGPHPRAELDDALARLVRAQLMRSWPRSAPTCWSWQANMMVSNSSLSKATSGPWRAQIVGPHGSGKSTLVAALVPALHACGRKTVVIELHDGQRRLGAAGEQLTGLRPDAVLIVDGFEQLSRFQRLRVRWRCRLVGCGLVVTAHRPVGLPTLWQTGADLETAVALVDELQSARTPLIGHDDVARAFERHEYDVREMLFEFYDLYEERTRADQSGAECCRPGVLAADNFAYLHPFEASAGPRSAYGEKLEKFLSRLQFVSYSLTASSPARHTCSRRRGNGEKGRKVRLIFAGLTNRYEQHKRNLLPNG